jgi:3-dehydroquinate synthase class II
MNTWVRGYTIEGYARGNDKQKLVSYALATSGADVVAVTRMTRVVRVTKLASVTMVAKHLDKMHERTHWEGDQRLHVAFITDPVPL